MRDDNLTLSVDLTNPDVYRDGHIVMPKDTVHVVRATYLWGGAAHQRSHVSNYGAGPNAQRSRQTNYFRASF